MSDYSFVLPGCCLTILLAAVVVLYQLRSWAGALCALSLAIGALSTLLIPAHNIMRVDEWAHAPGLTLLLIDLCATVAVALQFAFASTQSSAWSWKRAAALAVAAVLLLALPFLWIGAREAVGRDALRLLYQGYYAYPPPLLAWNVGAELSVTYAVGLALYAYARLAGEVCTWPGRVWVGLGVVVGSVGVAHGALVLCQIAASSLGYGATSTGVMSITPVLVMAVAGVTAALVGYFIVLHPTWHYIREYTDVVTRKKELFHLRRVMLTLAALNNPFDDTLDNVIPVASSGPSLWSAWYRMTLARQRDELKWLRQGVLDAATVLADQWRHLRHYADPYFSEASARLCHECGLSDYQSDSVAKVATCWITASSSMRRWAWHEVDDVIMPDVGPRGADDTPQHVRVMREFHAWSDVAHVVMVVATRGQWRAPERWQHIAAARIAQVLAERQTSMNRAG